MQLFNRQFKIVSTEKLYFLGKKFILWSASFIYKRFDGEEAGFKYIIFDRGSSVAVLLYRKDDDKICLVEQFRPATLINDHNFATTGGEILEIIAGTQEAGEKPLDCLHREAAEEAGRLLKNIQLVTNCFMSPGASSEKISIYIAEDDGQAGLPGGGLKEESEDIKIHWVTLTEAWEMIESGEINDAKTILAIQALLLKQMK
jgi:GDP-mannose pyrophosphatase NudK